METNQLDLVLEERKTDHSNVILVGKVLAKRLIPQNLVMHTLNAPRKILHDYIISDWGNNTFGFQFNDAEDAQNVLDMAPWFVSGNPIIIQRWEMEESIGELEFNLLPFWIQIHGLPRCMFTINNAIKIGNSLGKLVDHEGINENGPLLSFMRLRVELDVNLPLRTGFNARGEGGRHRWVSLIYERLEVFCYNCGKLGHVKEECYNRNDSAVIYNGDLRTTGRQDCLKMSKMIGKSTNDTDTEEKIDWIKVDQLKPVTSGHSLTVKVVSAKVVLQKDRQNGYHQIRHRTISECLVGDETGTILFTARNEQVDLMKTDSTLILHNAKIDLFKGSMRLIVDKWGQIEVTEPANFTVKVDTNLSLVEYEFVNVEYI